ncbi:hypothetical protein [Rhizobium phage RHph_X2_26]|nr:hypothetical protein [Rhizobium phage RHph_X2_26]
MQNVTTKFCGRDEILVLDDAGAEVGSLLRTASGRWCIAEAGGARIGQNSWRSQAEALGAIRMVLATRAGS